MHRQLGHVGFDTLHCMVKCRQIDSVTKLTRSPDFCEACVLGKMKTLPFPTGCQRAIKPLQYVHSDVGRPMTPVLHDGSRFWITFIDDFSGHPWIYFLHHKHKAEQVYMQWHEDVKAHFREEVRTIHLSSNFVSFFRTDGGGEYTSKSFEE